MTGIQKIWEWGSYFDGLMLSFVILLEVYEKLICDKGRDWGWRRGEEGMGVLPYDIF